MKIRIQIIIALFIIFTLGCNQKNENSSVNSESDLVVLLTDKQFGTGIFTINWTFLDNPGKFPDSPWLKMRPGLSRQSPTAYSFERYASAHKTQTAHKIQPIQGQSSLDCEFDYLHFGTNRTIKKLW